MTNDTATLPGTFAPDAAADDRVLVIRDLHVVPVASPDVEILRGIVLRGADWQDLLPHTVGLTICCAVLIGISLARFRKQLA